MLASQTNIIENRAFLRNEALERLLTSTHQIFKHHGNICNNGYIEYYILIEYFIVR